MIAISHIPSASVVMSTVTWCTLTSPSGLSHTTKIHSTLSQQLKTNRGKLSTVNKNFKPKSIGKSKELIKSLIHSLTGQRWSQESWMKSGMRSCAEQNLTRLGGELQLPPNKQTLNVRYKLSAQLGFQGKIKRSLIWSKKNGKSILLTTSNRWWPRAIFRPFNQAVVNKPKLNKVYSNKFRARRHMM